MPSKGKVILVGAGPGDPGLLTLKGAEWLGRAEAVVYDWLANAEFLKLAPKAEKIFVGKKGGTSYKKQSEINAILLKLARKGKTIVRLKGGDPFVFGRGGEEAEFLISRKIPFEVVPGVTAGTAAPAYAGIPVTDRRWASSVTFMTGQEDPGKKESGLDWKTLSALKGTLVSFMAVKTLPQMVKNLRGYGKPSATPVAVIEWGTLPGQKVVSGTLRNIVRKVQKAKIDSPALTVIGEVVKLRSKLKWTAAPLPLQGKTVLVTRSRAQASALSEKLREKGAEVVEYPVIEIQPPAEPRAMDREIKNLAGYDWVVFTSTNGVQSFFNRMKRLKKDARVFSGVRIAAIGEATAGALREQGIEPDLVPREFTSRALFEALRKKDEVCGKRFLLARADIAPPDLREALEKEGAEVTELEAYQTRKAENGHDLKSWIRENKFDYVTFTSSSTVKNFLDPIPRALRGKIRSKFISIGPVTSQTLRDYGFKPAREAREHTIDGLIEALKSEGVRPRGLTPFGVKR